MNKTISKLLLGVLFVLGAVGVNAQVTVTNPGNTTPALAATYGSLAAAITAVNATTAISGPVIITLDPGNPQTAPAGGYSITATPTGASATNNITFSGSSNTITAFTPQTVGNINDAIFKLIGADFITIQNFVMQENAGNAISGTAAANNMTEFGVALFYASATNGAQNNTIQNNTISLNRTYLNTFGIFSTSRTTATAMTTGADPTSTAGAISGNKIYTNAISNVNYGIVFLGGSTAAFMDNGNDIGGSSAGTGNTITNWGGGAALSAYVNLTGNSYCIFSNHQINDNISFNNITSASLTQSNTCGGILKNYSVTQPTGTITTTINNNTVTITNNPTAATTGGVIGINNQGLTPLLATATISVNNNIVQNCVLGGSTSTTNGLTGITNLSVPGTMNIIGNSIINNAITATTATSGISVGISNSGAAGTLNINNNTIRSLASTSTSGQIQAIANSGAIVNALNINGNALGNATSGLFSTSNATSGTLFGIVTSGGAATCALSIQSNDIRGITYNVAASAAQAYIQNTAATLSQNISSNTFTNLNVNTTGSVTFIANNVQLPASGTQTINSNSIVTAFNKGGAGGTVQVYFANTSPSSPATATHTANLNNFSNITVTGATAIVGWSNLEGAPGPTKNITNNTFSNWTGGSSSITVIATQWSGNTDISGNTISNITGTGSITGMSYSSSNGGTTQTCNNNTISSLVSSGAGGNVIGISGGSTSIPTFNITNNKISTLSSTNASAVVSGISITAGAIVNIAKNKIYDLSGNQTGTTVNGLNLTSGTTFNISNNLIGDLRATAATGLNAINGINASATATYNVYYNTVYLNATSSSATTFGTSCITFSSTATLFNSRNNILYNASTPAQDGLNTAANGISAGLRRSTGTAATVPANYATSSNNNAYWVNPSAGGNNHETYVEGTATITNPQNTVANLKAFMSTRDQASAQENVAWQSTTGSSANFLKYNTGVASQVESGASNIAGFTDDYLGTIRQGNGGYAGTGTAPDIGAWELEGIAADLTAPSISAITLVGNACNLTSRNITATLSDASGVATGGNAPRIYFRKNGGAYSSAAGSLTSGTVNSGTWTFTITYATLGGVAAPDVIDYFIVAQDINGNVGGNPSGGLALTDVNTVTTPPTTPLTYNIAAFLSGNYNVGAGQTYTTLTAAVAAYNSSCLSGAVTFSLTDATYTEAAALQINANADASATNTLTIKPTLAGTTIAVTGGSTTAIFILNGADYVTIDGSISSTANTICPLSAASRDLTITNTATNTTSDVIWLSSNGADGATNNNVVNCNIVGNGGSSAATFAGVFSGGSGGGAATAANNNNKIINNNISNCYYGVFTTGVSAAIKNTGTVINQNVMNAASPNQIGRGGILVLFDDGATISANNIGNISGVSLNYAWGISLGLAGTTTVTTTGSEVTNATVTKNVIGSIRAASTFGVAGIQVASAATGTTLIANNMVADAFANGTLSDIGAGIYIGGGAGTTNVYYNTVQMASTLTGGSYYNFGIAINGSNPVVDLRNNLVTNTGSNGANNNRALGLAYATFTNLTSNYNDFFVSGTSSAVVQSGSLSNSGFTSYTALTGAGGWNTVTSKDANSISVAPVFTSATDLHLVTTSNGGIDAKGTPVSVTDDIDCDTRNASTPDIGADEFTPPVITDAGVTAIVMPNPFCPGSNLVSATVRNFGTVTITSVLIDWSVTPGAAQPQVNPGAISIAPGASQTFPLGNFTFAAGTVYSITAATSLPNGGADGVGGNDAFTQNNIATGLVGTYTVGIGGNYTTLTAAVADFNAKSLCGAVVFSLTDATYPGETFPITINANAASSSTNTLTIKPASGISPVISGSNSTTLIDFNNGDWITIDGSNNGTTSKDLTISNTNTSGATIRFINDATNNIVKNSILNGVSTSTSNGIVFFSTTTGTTGNDNNTIQNNDVAAGATANAYGIYNSGTATSTATKNSGIQVIGNNIFNFSNTGIFDAGASVGTLYASNQIYEVNTLTSSLTGFRPSSTNIEGFTFTRNRIYDLKTTGTGNVYGIHLFDIQASASLIGQVTNNMISLDATAPLTMRGIYDQSATGEFFNVYYNSISLSGAVTGASNSEAYYWAIASTTNAKNNIFVNTRNGGTGKHYAIRFNTTLANISSDNNDIYPGGGTGNVFGNDGVADRVDLATWRTNTSKDANSISAAPVFVSATDLHVTTANIALKAGTPIAGITTDYDGDTRNATLPLIGADEILPLSYTWTGASSTDWSLSGNWLPTQVPTAFDNAIIPNVANKPALTVSVPVNAVDIAAAAFVDIAGQTFTIYGAVTGSGTLSGSATSNITIAGTAGTLNFTTGSRTLKDLTLNAGATATLGTPLDITAGATAGTVTVATGATLTTGGNLTLKSNALGTARVGNSPGTITGNATLERYINNIGRKWRLLSGKTIGSTQTILNAWQENGGAVNNLGTWITKPGGGSGYDGSSTNAGLLRFDVTGPAWQTVAATTSDITSEQGYMLFVRGDRNDLPATLGNSPTVLRTTGTLNQQAQPAISIPLANPGYTLVGNPFASALDFENFRTTTNLQQDFYIWDANLSGTYGVGGYRLVSRDNLGVYTVTPNGGLSNEASLRYISSGQAFFVKATGGNASLVLNENSKSAGTPEVLPIVAGGGDQQLLVNLAVKAGAVPSVFDGIRVRFDDTYSAGMSDDAEKISNFSENLAIVRGNKKWVLERRPLVASKDTIWLRLNNTGVKSYQLQLSTINFNQPGVTAWLQDAYLGTNTIIDLNGNNTDLDFSITSDAGSANPDRFRIVFTAALQPQTITTVTAAQQGNAIAVEWKAANQYNMKQYEVERSTDGINYTKVNTQAAKGTNGSDVVYRWLDVNPVVGSLQHPVDNFYRIRSVDANAAVKIAGPVSVKMGKGEAAITVYPNPVTGHTASLKFTGMEKGMYQVTLYSINGQLVFNKQVNHSGGTATQSLVFDRGIAKGTYRLQVTKPDNSKTMQTIIISE